MAGMMGTKRLVSGLLYEATTNAAKAKRGRCDRLARYGLGLRVHGYGEAAYEGEKAEQHGEKERLNAG